MISRGQGTSHVDTHLPPYPTLLQYLQTYLIETGLRCPPGPFFFFLSSRTARGVVEMAITWGAISMDSRVHTKERGRVDGRAREGVAAGASEEACIVATRYDMTAAAYLICIFLDTHQLIVSGFSRAVIPGSIVSCTMHHLAKSPCRPRVLMAHSVEVFAAMRCCMTGDGRTPRTPPAHRPGVPQPCYGPPSIPGRVAHGAGVSSPVMLCHVYAPSPRARVRDG